MATSLEWTDGEGAVSLVNGFPAPGDRFVRWKPMVNATKDGAGVRREALGTGITYAWNFRTDYGASFQLRYLPNDTQESLLRLKEWLENGGSITVNTGDSGDRSYTCYLWPGSEVGISEPDPKDKTYTLTLAVLNSVSSRMLCLYP